MGVHGSDLSPHGHLGDLAMPGEVCDRHYIALINKRDEFERDGTTRQRKCEENIQTSVPSERRSIWGDLSPTYHLPFLMTVSILVITQSRACTNINPTLTQVSQPQRSPDACAFRFLVQ